MYKIHYYRNKEAAPIGYNRFLFQHEHSGEHKCGKKPIISNTGNFFCFNSNDAINYKNFKKVGEILKRVHKKNCKNIGLYLILEDAFTIALLVVLLYKYIYLLSDKKVL